MLATSSISVVNVNDGSPGQQGATINYQREQWYLSNESTSLSPVPQNSDWSYTEPSTIPSGKYLWGRIENVMTDGSYTYSNPVHRSTISGVISRVSTVEGNITNKVWQTDIENHVYSDGSTTWTMAGLRDRVSDVEIDLDGIYTQVLDIQTTTDQSTGDVTYESRRISSIEQEADKIALMVSVDGTTSSLTLTQNMLSAMTSQFVVKDPTGSTTIISGGRISADAIKSTNYNSGTVNQLVPTYNATTNPYHFSTAGTYMDLASGNIYSPNFSVINTVPTGSSVSVGAYISGHINATSGSIGGCDIVNGQLTIGQSHVTGVYGTCDTGDSLQTKVVTCSGFTLYNGALITVKFTNSNTYALGAIKLRVNSNDSNDAKNVYVGNSETSSTNCLLWGSNAYITFRYDGTGFVVVGEPRTWYGACSTSAATAAKTSTIDGCVICKGSIVNLQMTNANSSASTTLNVSSTGSIDILCEDATLTSSGYCNWVAKSTISFVFDGRYWRYDSDASKKADNAAKTATNYLYFDSNNGLVISQTGVVGTGYNTQITNSGMNIRSGTTTLASYGSTITLGQIANGVTRVQIDNDSLDVISRDSNGVDTTFATFGNNIILGNKDIIGKRYVQVDDKAFSILSKNSQYSELGIDVYAHIGTTDLCSKTEMFECDGQTVQFTCQYNINGIIEISYDDSSEYDPDDDEPSIRPGYGTNEYTYSGKVVTLLVEPLPQGSKVYIYYYYTAEYPFYVLGLLSGVWALGTLGSYSLTCGKHCRASGDYSFACGIDSGASGESSIAIGNSAAARGDNSVAIGNNAFAYTDGSVVFGSFNDYPILFDDEYLFILGNGTDYSNRSNALTVDWSGNVNVSGNVIAANTSHIGMIIMSTTLSTMNDVIAVYGGTTWIQHSGYMLMGASSGVTSGDQHNVSDGGASTHDHGAKTGSVTLSAAQSGLREHGHGVYYKRANITANNSGNTHVLCHSSNTGATNWAASNANASGAVQKASSAAATSGHDHSISSASNLPPYKNVYIWERTA